MKEKLRDAENSKQKKIFALVLDSWSQKYCSEYFEVSEYLIQTARKQKKSSGILLKPAPKKGKESHNGSLILCKLFIMI